VTGSTSGASTGAATSSPFGRRQHRERRRHHAAAPEHGTAEHADQHHAPCLSRPVLDDMQRPRGQRDDATLAAVVGARDEDHILERNDDDQCPEEKRQAAQDAGFADRHRMAAGENLAERV
jgi:hypothetical protein